MRQMEFTVARRAIVFLSAGLAALAMATPPAARAVNVVIKYDYDSSGFFTANATAKAALEAAASFYSSLLDDTFSSIQTPPNFASQQFSGVAFWEWSLNFSNPGGNGSTTLQNQVIPANEYRIYAGAKDIGTLGVGGPGGYSLSSDNNGGGFTQAEINQINAIHEAFEDDVVRREETSGFARWGGAITFDSVGTTWHYNHSTPPPGGANDFFSVAIHELGHALGLGASDDWNALNAGGFFTGFNATSEYGGNPPLAGSGHWQSGTMSRIYGTNTPQEAAMDPEITVGTRKRLTQLDAAAMVDIGWEVDLTPPVNYNPADFNEDTFVNAADLTVWRGAFGENANGDADGDNDSDGRDLLIWQRQLGATSLAPAALGVPESSSCLYATLALAALAARRRPVVLSEAKNLEQRRT